MESDSGTSIFDLITQGGRRRSVYRSYIAPVLHRPNLTVCTGALVTRLDTDGHRVVGVEYLRGDTVRHAAADLEVVLSLGAINTPKVLMYSGIGDAAQLRRHGITVLQDLPGVGCNLQDHARFDCVWEYAEPLAPRNNTAEATFFAQSAAHDRGPDIQAAIVEVPVASPDNAERYGLPEAGWTLCAALLQPNSRGRIELTGPDPRDPLHIETNTLTDPDDVAVAMAAVEICRDVGNAAALRPYRKREVLPGNLRGKDLERFVRDAAMSYSHETCTAKMGRDDMSVVDSSLRVYGIDGLRVADGSIMPRVTLGNTMAPCVVIGERAADALKTSHGL
jgi:choline dehydrogenase